MRAVGSPGSLDAMWFLLAVAALAGDASIDPTCLAAAEAALRARDDGDPDAGETQPASCLRAPSQPSVAAPRAALRFGRPGWLPRIDLTARAAVPLDVRATLDASRGADVGVAWRAGVALTWVPPRRVRWVGSDGGPAVARRALTAGAVWTRADLLAAERRAGARAVERLARARALRQALADVVPSDALGWLVAEELRARLAVLESR